VRGSLRGGQSHALCGTTGMSPLRKNHFSGSPACAAPTQGASSQAPGFAVTLIDEVRLTNFEVRSENHSDQKASLVSQSAPTLMARPRSWLPTEAECAISVASSTPSATLEASNREVSMTTHPIHSSDPLFRFSSSWCALRGLPGLTLSFASSATQAALTPTCGLFFSGTVNTF
jgi:hypothetical protein